MDKLYPDWIRWTEPRQRAIANMAFNMGYKRLKGFKKMWKAIRKDDWEEAANQAIDSRWYKQVSGKWYQLSTKQATRGRAKRIVQMIRTGEDI